MAVFKKKEKLTITSEVPEAEKKSFTIQLKKIPGVEKSSFPKRLKPMLATLANESFDDKNWLFEIKWDGYRAIAEINGRDTGLYSRNLKSFSSKYKAIVNALQEIQHTAILDGEIVVLDEHGIAHFQDLQNHQKTGIGDLYYYAFDLLYLDGYDITNVPLTTRKALLSEIIPQNSVVRYCDHILENGKQFYELVKQKGVEGIIAKHVQSAYVSGKRSREWLKIKALMQQEAVIAGYTRPKGSRKHFGSLILGAYVNKELVYIGSSGGGFAENELEDLKAKLDVHQVKQCPFKEIPEIKDQVTWVKPEYVCEIKFQEWTTEQVMRQPVFLGLREDKSPDEVSVERVAESTYKSVKEAADKQKRVINGKTLIFTNLNKVLWPDKNLQITKKELIDYYEKIAGTILPYLVDRPEVLHRNPNGIKDEGFYQKDATDIPDWMNTIKIKSETEGKLINYVLCQDKAALLYLSNLGCIELNPWMSRIKSLERPDYSVIDLDPLNVSFKEVIESALAVKEVLDELKITGFCKTSGKKGIHILIPLGGKYTYDQSRQFAEWLVALVHEKLPKLTSIERMPTRRDKKVYLDFLQNRFGQTIAAPYALRPVKGACVSAPLKWSELNGQINPADFNIHSIFHRLEKEGDLFHGLLKSGGIDMKGIIQKQEETKITEKKGNG